MKRFDVMALYHRQACIKSDEGDYVTISKVENYQDYRLCRTEGNVNLTDYWFAMVDASLEQPKGYNVQFISLLSDAEEEENWWTGCSGKMICICFFKFRSEERNFYVGDIKEKIIKCTEGKKSNWFRTFDNADAIFIFLADTLNEIDDTLQRIKSVELPYNGEGMESVFFTDYYLKGKCDLTKIPGAPEGLKILNYSIETGVSEFRDKVNIRGWCAQTIEYLKSEITEYKGQKNKKMISYFQGLMQIVNVLSQYEQVVLLKDMFYIFYPPIALFKKQLEAGETIIHELRRKALEEKGEARADLVDQKYIQMKKLEFGISEFLDSEEMLMRHMGQSCPDMLHDTGRQGLPYDIPLRLCLMYTAYLNLLTSVLNDKNPEYEYQYCLTPMVYSRPTTNHIDFGLPPKSRLIRVKISRHCMFMPRSSLIILAHEVSHYVGDNARQRRKRANSYVTAVSVLMTYAIAPDDILKQCKGEAEEILKRCLKLIQSGVYGYFETMLRKEINSVAAEREEVFHFSELCKVVILKCRELLHDDTGNLKRVITDLKESLYFDAVSIGKSTKIMRKINSLHCAIWDKTDGIWEEEKLQKALQSLKTVFKESYTDLSSIILLGLSVVDYLEAILISESYDPEPDIIRSTLINRVAMVILTMKQYPESEWGEDWEKLNEGKLNNNGFLIELTGKVRRFLDQYYNDESESSLVLHDVGQDILFCRQILRGEKEYLLECSKMLKKQIDEGKYPERVGMLRKLYRQFAVNEKGKDPGVNELFEAYDQVVSCCKKDIQNKWTEERHTKKGSENVQA